MSDIHYIKEDTDLKKVLHELSWDVMVKGEPYKAYFAYDDEIDYNHSIGGRFDNAWCCPRDKEPTFENIMPFDGSPCNWSFEAIEDNTFHSHMGDDEVEDFHQVIIKRNGEGFYTVGCRDLFYGVAKAQVLIEEFKEHPLNLNSYDFVKKEVVGRKIQYNGIPAVITKWFAGSADIAIKPENPEDIDRFYKPLHNIDDGFVEDSYDEWKQLGYIKTSILDDSIWWFRH